MRLPAFNLRPLLPQLPRNESAYGWPARFTRTLDDHLTRIGISLFALSSGRLAGSVNADSAAPTGGAYAVGDFVRNSAPAEAGGAGAMYVIIGWVCVAEGNPGTWKECRVLTGN